MSAKKKRQDSLKAKEKKQKVIAAVGGVLLVGLLAFQVPRVLKQMHHGSASAAAVPATVSSPTSASPTPSPAAPTTPGGGEPTPTGTASAVSADASATLASFSRFESKDPFRQQVSPGSTGSTAAAPPAAQASASTPVPTPAPVSSSGSSAGTTDSTSSTSSAPTSSPAGRVGTQPAPGGAVVTVNGTLMTVSVGSDFPAAAPLFHLLSVTTTTAKMSIAGGSYSNGAASVTLHVNKPVTLMNTADGTRYKLILKPQGTPVPAAAITTPTGKTTSG